MPHRRFENRPNDRVAEKGLGWWLHRPDDAGKRTDILAVIRISHEIGNEQGQRMQPPIEVVLNAARIPHGVKK